MMHRLVVGLLAFGCSGAPDSGPTGDGDESSDPVDWQVLPYESGQVGSPGVWVPPYDCWEGCSVASDVVAGSGAPCSAETTQAGCEGRYGWLSSPQGPGTVPGCGQVGMWLERCIWWGSACGAGSFYQTFQTCQPE